MMEWLNPDTFTVAPNNPWAQPQAITKPFRPDFADNEQLKQEFGIALAKGLKAFDAGMEMFNQEMPKALWASTNWISDPVVIAAKDVYRATIKKLQKPLDKEQLLAKILEFADETVVTKDGQSVPLVEAKERLNAYKLYSEVAGFTGKIDINASTNNTINQTNNEMKIILVRPDNSKQIEQSQAPNIKSKILNEELPSIPLKLVGGSSR